MSVNASGPRTYHNDLLTWDYPQYASVCFVEDKIAQPRTLVKFWSAANPQPRLPLAPKHHIFSSKRAFQDAGSLVSST